MMTTLTIALTVLTCSLFTLLWFACFPFKNPLDNVAGPVPLSRWKGNLDQLYDRHGWEFHDEVLDEYSSVVKLHGVFGRRMLYVRDPTALYDIVIKDPYTFEPLRWFTSFVSLVFGPGLPATHGEQHRKQRKLLNPVFSGKFIRSLTPVFYEVAHQEMRDAITAELRGTQKEVDLLGCIHKAALEALGRGGLGCAQVELTASQSHDTYGDTLKAVSQAVFSLGHFRMLSPWITLLPVSIRRFLVRFVPHAGVRRMARLSSDMNDRAREIFYAKKATVLDSVESNIMSVLMRTNMDANKEDQLPDDELVGQMSTLVFAGTDTTTSAIAKIIDLLARFPAVQDKLRKEVSAACDGGEFTYDALMNLPFLDAVCRETLRLYPPATFVYREAVKDTILPLSRPIYGINGTLLSEIVVPKGTTVIIGIRGCNLNRELWGLDAREWKPERWLSPLPEAVKSAQIPGVYSNLMTFLGGGRSCIGFKFSQLEIKVLLAVLLQSLRFSRSTDIYWNLSTFCYPTAGSQSSVPEMPIMVEPL